MSYNKEGKENIRDTKCSKKNGKGTNHPSWYTKTASIESLVGANFFKKKAAIHTTFANSSQTWLQMPNMSLDLVMTIPQDKTNAFHTDITQLYKNIRRSNSGAANYTVADLERYVLNVRSIRAYLAHLVRVRRAFNSVDPLNQTVPFDLINTIVGSNNLDASAWLDSLASVDAQLSKMGALIETALPCGDLNVFDRTDWLYGNVFVDSDGPKFSYIACNSRVFPIYDSDGVIVTLGSTQPLTKPGPTVDLSTACKNLWTVFAAFNGEYKNALIAGDIMHAYGERSFKRTLHWSEVNQPLPLVYDTSVLTQIMNATIGTRLFASLETSKIESGVVTQVLTYSTTATTTKSVAFDYAGTYINGKAYAMSGGELLTVTRLCWHGTNQDDKIQIQSCGTEIVSDLIFWYCGSDGISARYQSVSGLLSSTQSSVQSTAMTALKTLASLWSKVDWAPMILLYNDTQVFPLWDVNNIAFIDWNTLDDYHSAATTSLFWAVLSQ